MSSHERLAYLKAACTVDEQALSLAERILAMPLFHGGGGDLRETIASVCEESHPMHDPATAIVEFCLIPIAENELGESAKELTQIKLPLLMGKLALNGHYFSFATGGDPGHVIDRFEARASPTSNPQSEGLLTLYRNNPVGSTMRVDSASAHPMESYEIVAAYFSCLLVPPDALQSYQQSCIEKYGRGGRGAGWWELLPHGSVIGIVQVNGDIAWGYAPVNKGNCFSTSRKDKEKYVCRVCQLSAAAMFSSCGGSRDQVSRSWTRCDTRLSTG